MNRYLNEKPAKVWVLTSLMNTERIRVTLAREWNRKPQTVLPHGDTGLTVIWTRYINTIIAFVRTSKTIWEVTAPPDECKAKERCIGVGKKAHSTYPPNSISLPAATCLEENSQLTLSALGGKIKMEHVSSVLVFQGSSKEWFLLTWLKALTGKVVVHFGCLGTPRTKVSLLT